MQQTLASSEGPTVARRRVAKRGALRPLLSTAQEAAVATMTEDHAQRPLSRRHDDMSSIAIDLLRQGVWPLVERHALPAGMDLEAMLTSNGPMRASRAVVHSVRERPTRMQVMTETSGFSKAKGYKLDYSEIERLPAKMNMAELKQWEQAEAKEQAAANSTNSNKNQAALMTPPAESSSTSALAALAGLQRDDPRTYTELLDLYSMHEFIIRKGKTLRNTPEFASFKRHYSAAWGVIESLIQSLERFLSGYGVELAYVDGKQLAALAAAQPGTALLTERDLLRCLANPEDVEPLLGNAGQQFRYGAKGHDIAAAKIQSTWRMYRQRIAYKHVLVGTKAATVIQRQWALHRAHTLTRRSIRGLQESRLARWRQTMATFVQRWPDIRHAARTVIHLPSLSYPSFHAKKVPFYEAQQLSQLMRVCELADGLVEMVLIAPYKPEPEVVEYYHNLLVEAGVGNAAGRLTLLVPEEANRLPAGMSLTRMVLLSSRLMKVLAAMSKGRPAYIVPGVIGPEELALATQLNVPLLGPEPRVAQVLGTKSGCQRLLEAAEVSTPIGATQLRSRGDLLRALAKLILDHREITRWLIKLETEAGSRGHAYFDTSRMRSLRDAASHAAGPSAEANNNANNDSNSGNGGGGGEIDGRARLFESLLRELTEYGAKRVRLVHPSCYTDWAAYLNTLDLVGASIEAVPARLLGNVSAQLFIEPSGEVHLRSVVEPMQSPAFTVMGSCFPCTMALPYEAVRDAALSVGRAAFRKRIMGYLSVDFVLFEKPSTPALAGEQEKTAMTTSGGNNSSNALVRLWGVDVDLCLTNNAIAHEFACTLTHSVWDAMSGTCRSPRRGGTMAAAGASLHYVYSGLIYNPFIAAIRHGAFFALCRSHGVNYDKARHQGMVFQLVDVLLRCCLGALAIGTDRVHVVRCMSTFQSLLNLELPKQGEHSAESNFVYFSAIVRQLARLTRTPSISANST